MYLFVPSFSHYMLFYIVYLHFFRLWLYVSYYHIYFSGYSCRIPALVSLWCYHHPVLLITEVLVFVIVSWLMLALSVLFAYQVSAFVPFWYFSPSNLLSLSYHTAVLSLSFLTLLQSFSYPHHIKLLSLLYPCPILLLSFSYPYHISFLSLFYPCSVPVRLHC